MTQRQTDKPTPLRLAFRIVLAAAAIYLPFLVGKYAIDYVNSHPTISAEHRGAATSFILIMTAVWFFAAMFGVACFLRLSHARSSAGAPPPDVARPD
ncbi:MAG: hypothetical protein EA379_09080 [Phycisphaerales bacterium]|nr:MAG: hypothetical protein EA379_09080 [Phycisphaerales bacterium]